MAGEEVPWPPPPREPGPWNGGPPVAPPGNTPLPPLPGAGGVVHEASPQANPWANPGGDPASPNGPGTWASPAVPQVNIPPQRQDPFPGLPEAPKLVDRAPVAVLVVSAIIVLALVAGGAYVLLKGGRQYPSAWDARVAPIATWAAQERELEFDHPVQVNFLTEEEYSKRATEGGDDESAESQQYYADQVAQLRALGLVSGDVDLAKANDTLSDSGTLAYYDPELEQVFVRGTEMTPALEVTLAHELVHVLQDQNFDLERFDQLSSGRASVLRALAEGDATKVEDAYVAQLSKEDKAAYDKETESSGEEVNEEIDEVPPFLTTVFASPYILGPRLVDNLDAIDGWKAIDEALLDPPTEEVMFDPSTYKTEAGREQTVEIEAPEGTEVLESDEFGPTTWFLLLASRLDAKTALQAVDGWGGDQYVVYREDDTVCMNATIQGDTPEDVTELADALGEWAEQSPEGTAEVTSEGDEVQFRSCDPGKDAKAVGKEVTPETLLVPIFRTDAYTSAISEGHSTSQAKCFADGVVDRFSTEQLGDPEGEFLMSNEGQMVLAQLRSSCFE